MGCCFSSPRKGGAGGSKPWYGLDDAGFIPGVETVFTNSRGLALAAKGWTPMVARPVDRLPVTAVPASDQGATGAGTGAADGTPPPSTPATTAELPHLPRGVIVVCHGYVRVTPPTDFQTVWALGTGPPRMCTPHPRPFLPATVFHPRETVSLMMSKMTLKETSTPGRGSRSMVRESQSRHLCKTHLPQV
jgi:hypothetical protein